MMLLLRRVKRMKRGMCIALGCYAAFLLIVVWTAGEKKLTDRLGQPDMPQIHHQDNDKRNNNNKGDDMSDDKSFILLPESLDRVLQHQPGRPAARKKLSRPDVQRVKVIVEDAPPGTFVKHATHAEMNSGFKDLQQVKLRKHSPAKNSSENVDPRSLDKLIAGRNSPKGFPMPTKENSVSVIKDGVHSTIKPIVEKDDASFRDFDRNAEDSEEKVKNPVWISPDGAVDGQSETLTDVLSSENLETPPDRQEEEETNLPSDQRPVEEANRPSDQKEALEPTKQLKKSSLSHPPVSVSSNKLLAPANFSVSRRTANFVEISDVIIYSAFYDDRLRVPLLRMLALGPISGRLLSTRLWCVYGFESAEPAPVSVHQTADCRRMKKYCFYMLHCQIPETLQKLNNSVDSLMIVSSEGKDKPLTSSGEHVRLDVIFNRNVTKKHGIATSASGSSNTQSLLFSVCVPPLFGKLTVLQVVEFIEVNRLLGASHFTFYTFRVSGEVSRLLAFYERAGLVRVMPWNIPAPNDVWNKGESLALGDCLFRNMFLFDYLVFSKLNEILVPRQRTSWQALVEMVGSKSNRMKTAAYEVLSVKFYPNETATNAPAGVTKSETSKFLTLRNTLRGKTLSGNFTKLLVKPERVLEADSQSVLKPVSEVFVSNKLDPHTASVFHFTRKTCSNIVAEMDSAVQNCNKLFEDRTMWRYQAALMERTKALLKALNRQAGESLT